MGINAQFVNKLGKTLEIWVYFTLLAALMQAIRTAGQKRLSGHLNSIATTSVRYVYALPFAWLYFWWLLDYKQVEIPDVSTSFIQYALIASVTQIIGTACLITAFRYRNFSVATSLAKTEAVQIAIIGATLFSSPLGFWAWVSVIIGVLGVIIVSKVNINYSDLFQNPGAGFGLASGLGLAITMLLVRESSLALNTDLMVSAAFTLAFMVTVQSFLSLGYVAIQNRTQLPLMIKHWRLCLFVGLTSVIGSIGWYTASSYQNTAYVKALGQIEFFITLFITYRIFKESISKVEYLGMFLILLSVFILLLWA